MINRTNWALLLIALLVGFLIRLPGVLWGYNFPFGWSAHHIDEYSHWVQAENLIDPSTPLRWYHPYPKGTAAHVAVLWILFRGASGQLSADPPGIVPITVTGRVINSLYGAATILVVYWIARRLFKDERVSLIAAWIMALGGLHVTQSHFFLADVPGLFWFLLGSYFLLLELEKPEENYSPYLMAASFSFGFAFGIKLVMFALPTLAVVALWCKPRGLRAVYALVFFVSGFVIVNLFSFNHYDFLKTFLGGISDPFLWTWWSNLFLYLVELPSLISFPILALAVVGVVLLIFKFVRMERTQRFWSLVLIIVLPQLINAYFVVFQLDHFLRHMIPFIPWAAIAAGWTLVRIADWLKLRRINPIWVYAPVFIYLALFVFDGERVFIQEPRNEAARWLLANLPQGGSYSWRGHTDLSGYRHVYYPDGEPDVILIEMHHANHYLSGMGLKNSYPRDYRYIFDSGSQQSVDMQQALFKGATEYKETTRFSEGYFMPEYNLVNRLIGDRSRNYVTEVVIFSRNGKSVDHFVP